MEVNVVFIGQNGQTSTYVYPVFIVGKTFGILWYIGRANMEVDVVFIVIEELLRPSPAGLY